MSQVQVLAFFGQDLIINYPSRRGVTYTCQDFLTWILSILILQAGQSMV